MTTSVARRVCVVVASRANYGRIKSLLKAINGHSDLELQLIVGASALLGRFGGAVDVIEKDGFQIHKKLYYVIEGENLVTQAKSSGLGIIELATAFEELQPDFVITVADRYETMATALAAVYLNIPLIHIQGGEVSGNVDDKIRHSISKLADYHFVATSLSRIRLIRMGESEGTIFNYGCPSMDIIKNTDLSISNILMEKYTGVGDYIDFDKPYILLIQHPVTSSYGQGAFQMNQTLHALKKIDDYQKVVMWPNSDAGSDDTSKAIRMFREKGGAKGFHFYKNFSPEDYVKVMANASCLVGNSSSFLREGEYLNIPAVIVGDRQIDREYGDNVIFSDYNESEIYDKTIKQLEQHPNRKKNSIYGSGDAGNLIANEIAQFKPGFKLKRLDI